MGSWYENIWNGSTDVAQGLGGFTTDLFYTAPSRVIRGDIPGAADAIVGSAQEDLLGKTVTGLFGPEGIGGTIIGAIPEPIRQPAKQVIDPVFGVMNFALEEIVDRPLGTIATVVNTGLTNPGSLLDFSTYARAYAINDERTVGQSIMAAMYFIDPFDDEEFTGLQNKPIFNLYSGVIDFAAEFADPTTYFGGLTLKGARGAAVAGRVSAAGEVLSTHGRRFANSTRVTSGRRLSVRPQLNSVLGRRMGLRPATIAGKRRGIFTANDAQYANRLKIANMFVDERAQNFRNSQAFRDMNNAVQEGATAAERASIASMWMGNAARKFGAANIVRWANGATVEARELSMRVMMGDSTAHVDAIEIAHEIQAIQNSPQWVEASRYRRGLLNVEDGFTIDADGVQLVNPKTGEIVPVSPEAIELSKQYDELVGKVDWSLVHQTNQALKAAAPRQLVIDPETGLYTVKETADQVMASVDDSIAVQAIEDLLGRVDPDGKYSNSIFSQTGQVRNLPYGARINGIFAEHLEFLNRNADANAAVTTYVDPDTFLGNSPIVRFITERVSRGRVFFHDSGSTTDVQRTLRDATRLNIPGMDQPVMPAERAREIVQQYETLRSQGRIAEAQELFLSEIRRIHRLLDNYLEKYHDASGQGFAYQRHIEAEYEEALAKHTGQNINGTKRNDARETNISIQDEDGSIYRWGVFDDDGPDLGIYPIQVAQIRISPRQLERSAVLPRYDLLQKNIDLMQRRLDPRRRIRYTTKAGDVVRKGVRIGSKVTYNPMKYWRAGTLLNPKWPMRITLEEQLRMATQLGTLTTAANFFSGVGNLRRAYAFHNFPQAEIMTDYRMLEDAVREEVVKKRTQAVKDEMASLQDVNTLTADERLLELDRELYQPNIPRKVNEASIPELMVELGADGFQKLVKDLTKQKVLTRRALRRTRSNSALKAVGMGALFANPFVGGVYGFISYQRKTKRMMQAAQRSAAFTMSASLKARARQMLLDNPNDRAAYEAAMDIMSEADYIKKLADEEEQLAKLITGEDFEAQLEDEVGEYFNQEEIERIRGIRARPFQNAGRSLGPNTIEDFNPNQLTVGTSARTVANAFDVADDLLERAGFGNLQIGGQGFRSGFGDDPRFASQIQREVSANRHASALLRGTQENIARDLAESSKPDFIISDVLEVGSEEFGPMWQSMFNRMSSPSIKNKFYQVVWGLEPKAERIRTLAKMLDEDPDLFASLVSDVRSEFVAGQDTTLIAEYIIQEYDNVIPPGAFPQLRKDAAAGLEVRWSDIEESLEDVVRRSATAGQPRTMEEIIQTARSEDTYTGLGRQQQGLHHFGKALHPETIDVKNSIQSQIDSYIEEFFQLFGTLPSDELSRFPFYKSTYDTEMRRLTYGMLDDDGMLRISQNQMDELERQAREYALAETRNVLFELSETSRLGEVIGNASPFFSAYQEVIGRWAGFAVDNPFFIAKVGQLYRQPWESEFLGLTEVTMGEGERESTYIVFRPFGDAWDEEGNNVTIFEAMPESIRSLFIPAAMRDAEAPIRFSKSGINMIVQGSPGFGPLITVPVREAMNVEPELEKTLKFMFPFGHPHGDFFDRTRAALMPAWSKNVENMLRDTHTRETVVNRMFRDLTIQMAEAGDPLDWNDEMQVMEVLEEAEKRTQNFFMFRVAAGLFSPTSTTVLSPYDGLVQEYRDLEQNMTFREAQTVFLDKYGTDFFALTGRMSQLNDGVATTIESENLFMENQNLVQAHPEIGAWITGSVGSFDEEAVFSQIVYNKQFAEPVFPGAQETRREIKTPVEYVQDTQVQQGWNEYSALMSQIRSMQDRSGAAGLSTAITASHMARVKEFKDRIIADISARFPAWREEFDDFGSSRTRLTAVYDGFAAALEVPSLLARPSTKHILEFLSLRLATQDLLTQRREAGYTDNIKANENQDILLFWEESKEEMGQRPDFESIYDRYFARDDLAQDTFINREDFPVLESVIRY